MATNQRVYNYSTARKNSAQTTGRRNQNVWQGDYIYGNAVPKQDIRRQLEEAPKKRLSNEARKNREKARHMSLGYVAFLVAALCLAGMILINYIQLQAGITNMAETLTTKERQLNNLKVDNDETLNRINAGIDMEEIKRIAIGELGMTYAREGQIETYSNEGNDYLRRVAEDWEK